MHNYFLVFFLFKELIKLSGIGPKTALAILATMKPIEFVNAVRRERADELIKIPGIGKRSAERILVEIKDKVASYGISTESSDPLFDTTLDNPQETSKDVTVSFEKKIEEQAVDAFVGLGYTPKQASLLVHKHCKEGMSVEEVIKEVLRNV